MLMTAGEYINSLRKLELNLYLLGDKVEDWVDHPIIRPSINAIAMTYKVAHESENGALASVDSSLSDEKVNKFNSLFLSTDDLVNEGKLQRILEQRTACCFQRCVGVISMKDTHTGWLGRKTGKGFYDYD